MTQALHEISLVPGQPISAVADSAFPSVVAAATTGGSSVFDLFQKDLSALNHLLRSAVSGGESVWVDGHDEDTGHPVCYIKDGDTYLTLSAWFSAEGSQELTRNQPDPVDVGFACLSLTNTDGTTTQVTADIIQYTGSGMAIVDPQEALKDLISQTLDMASRFVTKIMSMVLQQGAGRMAVQAVVQSQTDAQQAARSTARVTPVRVARQQVVPVKFGVRAAAMAELAVGLGLIGLNIILLLMSKGIQNYVRIYNHTDLNLNCRVSYTSPSTVLFASPMPRLAPVELPAMGQVWTPTSLIGEDACPFLELAFANNDSLSEVEYVIQAEPTGDFPGFDVSVQIPNSGDNSLGVSLSARQSGPTPPTNLSTDLFKQVESGPYTLSIATNQLNGESSSPVSGVNGYNYQHVVTLDKAA